MDPLTPSPKRPYPNVAGGLAPLTTDHELSVSGPVRSLPFDDEALYVSEPLPPAFNNYQVLNFLLGTAAGHLFIEVASLRALSLVPYATSLWAFMGTVFVGGVVIYFSQLAMNRAWVDEPWLAQAAAVSGALGFPLLWLNVKCASLAAAPTGLLLLPIPVLLALLAGDRLADLFVRQRLVPLERRLLARQVLRGWRARWSVLPAPVARLLDRRALAAVSPRDRVAQRYPEEVAGTLFLCLLAPVMAVALLRADPDHGLNISTSPFLAFVFVAAPAIVGLIQNRGPKGLRLTARAFVLWMTLNRHRPGAPFVFQPPHGDWLDRHVVVIYALGALYVILVPFACYFPLFLPPVENAPILSFLPLDDEFALRPDQVLGNYPETYLVRSLVGILQGHWVAWVSLGFSLLASLLTPILVFFLLVWASVGPQLRRIESIITDPEPIGEEVRP